MTYNEGGRTTEALGAVEAAHFDIWDTDDARLGHHNRSDAHLDLACPCGYEWEEDCLDAKGEGT